MILLLILWIQYSLKQVQATVKEMINIDNSKILLEDYFFIIYNIVNTIFSFIRDEVTSINDVHYYAGFT